jgi:hypothetical protein
MNASAPTLLNEARRPARLSVMSPAFVPLGVLAASAVVAWHYDIALATTDASALVTVGGTIASIAATMLGFLLAALAVLASINHTHLVKMMRQTGHYSDLLLTIFCGCLLFMVCCSIGVALTFGLNPPEWLRVGIVAIHVAAAASLTDVGRKFWLVLSHLRSE